MSRRPPHAGPVTAVRLLLLLLVPAVLLMPAQASTSHPRAHRHAHAAGRVKKGKKVAHRTSAARRAKPAAVQTAEAGDALNLPPTQKRRVKRALMTQYASWRGTRYRMGGTTHRGVDCSALMQHVFQDAFHRRLPRTAAEQRHLGRRVTRRALRPGDLVFFHTRSGVRHVGVYVGDRQFMHASGKKGVTVSRLNSDFWLQHYDTARRLTLGDGAS